MLPGALQGETPSLNQCLSHAARLAVMHLIFRGEGLCSSRPGFPRLPNLPSGKRSLKELLRF